MIAPKSKRNGGFYCITFYARALAMLPATAHDIAEELGINAMRARRMMAQLWHMGLAYPGEKRKIGVRQYAPVWLEGKGEPVIFSHMRPCIPSITVVAFGVAMRTLQSPCTKRELMDATGLCESVVRKLLKFLHENKRIHIASWSRQAYMPVEDWLLGEGEDMPRPAALTKRQQLKRNAMLRRESYQKTKQLRVVRAIAGIAANSAQVEAAA